MYAEHSFSPVKNTVQTYLKAHNCHHSHIYEDCMQTDSKIALSYVCPHNITLIITMFIKHWCGKCRNYRMVFSLHIFMVGSLSKVLFVRSLCFSFWLDILHFSYMYQENLRKPSQCNLTMPCTFNILQQDCRELSLYKNRHGFLYLCFSSVQQQKLCKSNPQKLYLDVYSTFRKLEGCYFLRSFDRNAS